ncbi:hypothetical protein ACOSP7_020563 [Xanthoceras sorbifolium]
MCRPNFDPLVGVITNQGTRFEVRRVTAREVLISQQASAAMASGSSHGGGCVDGGGGATKKSVCICSTTSHPGSFRCRYHRTDYRWVVGRVGTRSS